MNSRLSTRLALVGSLTLSLLLSGAGLPAFSAVPHAAASAPAAAEESLDSDGDGMLDRPDALSASLAAQSRDERVEDLSRRTPTTQVFANADGTWTTENVAGPVRAQDSASGDWAPIDTHLEKSGGLWAPKSAVGEMRFSNGGDAQIAAFTNADGEEVSWSWPTALPAPAVEGSTLTYPNVLPDADLVVEALPDGFSHSVVLRSAPTEELEIPIEIRTGSAKLKETADGSLVLAGPHGEMLTAPAPTMWDTGVGPVGEPTVVPLSTDVAREGGATVMTLKPDSDFLDDADTVYPVTIDPTFTATVTAWATINPDSATPFYNWEARVGFDGSTRYETVLGFDETAVLDAGDVATATLSMFASSSNDCDPVPLKVRRVLGMWDPFADVLPVTTAVDETTVAQTAKGGPGACAAKGWDSWDITALAKAWTSNGDFPLLTVSSATPAVADWRQYDTTTAANYPKITITGDRLPGAPSAPVPSDSQTWNGTYHTRIAKPSWSTSATDPDLGTVRYTTEIHDTNTAGSPVRASCITGFVQSGATASCTPSQTLADGTFYARSAADDGHNTGPWSPWQQFTVNYDQPEPVAISCPGTADAHWYATSPASSMACTFTSGGAAELEWTLNGVTQTTLAANGSGVATKTGIAIPTPGWTELKVRGLSTSGRASGWKTYAFGTGSAAITSPAAGAGTAKTFTYGAASATGATSAKLQFSVPGTGWFDATAVRTADGSTWGGAVVSTPDMSSLPEVIWTPAAETGIKAPMSLYTRVVFSYPNGAPDRASPGIFVQLNAHDTAAGSPTVSVGPGSVSLGTGEFQTTAFDAVAGDLAVGRFHMSEAEPATGAAGVFGRGWSAGIAPSGPAAFVVADRREESSSFTLTTPDGVAYVYRSMTSGIPTPSASTLTGVFEPQGDAVALGATLKLDQDGEVLTYTEGDGERTTFERRSSRWVPTATVGTAEASTTSYYYDTTTGLPSWIIAPPPPGAGVTCTPESLPAGCEGLNLNYVTVGGQPRLASVDHQGWDPKLTDGDGDAGNDGKPDGSPGVTKVSIAKYAYNTNGTLQAAWDPRVGDGSSALKTTYEYATSGTKTRLTKITPPGLKPWEINYASDGSVTTITRAQDPGVGSGNATWSIRYGLGLSLEGDGLPNLSAAKTAAWGQRASDAPEAGAAVFGPDRVPAVSPSATDWKFARLFYWNTAGRLTNTASYGLSAWQISTSRYDAYGNETWSLSPSAKAKAIADGAGNAANSAVAADRYATQTLYDARGTRVEAQYGPTIPAMTETGTVLQLRSLTRYDYDDEVDLAYAQGRDLETVPEGGFGVVVATRTSATNETTAGAWAVNSAAPPATPPTGVYDTKLVRYRYDPATPGDASGWVLRQATQVKVQNGASWDTSIYRYDTTGRILEERSPEGVATNQPARWNDTVYYTADASASLNECRDNAAWAGLICWEGPAEPLASGQQIPSVRYTGYSRDGAVTRTETSSGGATKVQVRQYDAAGRSIRSATTTTGTSDQAVPATTTAYSTTTGLPTSVDNGAMTLTTQYDTWGRVTAQGDGAGSTTVTTYNAAAQVATINDGKGTYTYAYNETFADLGFGTSSTEEHRGAPTSVNGGISGVTGSVRGVYDADGALARQQTPGATTASDWRFYDLAGNLTSRSQVVTGWIMGNGTDNTVDAQGRVLRENGPTGTVDYSYDDRGRLVKATDKRTSASSTGCHVRTYTLTADSNRSSLKTYNPNTSGQCQTTTAASTKTNTFDAASRITNTGYAYDDLGRTTTLPSADTSSPAAGNVVASYYANDMVAALTQSTNSQTFTLDPLGRISTTTDRTGGVSLREATNHYADGSDSPAWTVTKTRPNASTAWTETWTRYVRGLDGAVAIIQSSTGPAEVPTYNAHGDAISSLALGGTVYAAFTTYTEFGSPLAGSARPGRYGWLGQFQRDSQAIGGLTLMGVRLYNANTGLFLSRDPVAGANDTPYLYPADPINQMDLSGAIPNWVFKGAMGLLQGVVDGGCAVMTPNPLASAVCGAISGAFMGAIRYIGYHKLVKHDDWSWKTAGVEAAEGLVEGLAAGVVGGFGKDAIKSAIKKAVSAVFGAVKKGLNRVKLGQLAAILGSLQIMITSIATDRLVNNGSGTKCRKTVPALC